MFMIVQELKLYKSSDSKYAEAVRGVCIKQEIFIKYVSLKHINGH